MRRVIRCWRRPRRTRRSRVWASGSGRGVGRITSAQCASARASNASVLANCPVARAKSRACRGLTTTTGRPAVANAAVAARSRPPVASSTIRVGGSACNRSTSVTTPPASLGTAHRSPEGRTAISHCAFATSIPTKHGTSTIGTPVCPTLQRRAQWHQTTVRACGAQDVTTHAPLRSRRTKAESVCDAQVLSAGDSPPSPIKIPGCFPSPAGDCSAGYRPLTQPYNRAVCLSRVPITVEPCPLLLTITCVRDRRVTSAPAPSLAPLKTP